MFRIMIVEDETAIVRELEVLLRNAMYEPIVAHDFFTVPQQIKKETPDLVLLDMNLPQSDGLSICQKIRQQSEIPIIFVTANNTSMDELNCMMRGGDDYITKPYQAPILLVRIAAVLKRCKKMESKQEVRFIHNGVTLDVAAGTIEVGGMQTELTKNELKILYYLFLHPGVIVKREDIIDYLWEQQMFIDDNTLSVNVTRIRKKLTELGTADFIETKRGLGYKI